MNRHLLLLMLFLVSAATSFSQQSKPLRIGVAGLTHDHVHGPSPRVR